MKYKIEKNTVQETLLIPLYGRKMCSRLYPSLYRDETAIQLIDQLDYDFSVLEKKSGSLMQRFGFLECAMRQNDLAFEVRDYLKTHPNAAVVNLGCGLDSTGRACDNGSCKIYNLDFPEVIRVQDELLPAGEREENIPCDLNDTAWFDKIDVPGTEIHIFYALKMGENYRARYQQHFANPVIHEQDLQHEELLASYPEQWAALVKQIAEGKDNEVQN